MPTESYFTSNDSDGVEQEFRSVLVTIGSPPVQMNIPVKAITAIRAVLSATPTISASPVYSTGDSVGGLLSFTNAVAYSGGSGVIENVIIKDLAKQDAELDLILFDTNPTNTTPTDNAALDIHDTDLATVIAIINISTYADFSDNSVGQSYPVGGLPFKLTTGTTLYGLLVNRTETSPPTTPQYSTTSDITVRLVIRQD